MKQLAVVFAFLLLAPIGGAQSVLPVLPGDDWVVIEPGSVESGADYANFEDVFLLTPAQKWKSSAIYESYPDQSTAEEGFTYEALRANVQALSDRLAVSLRFQEHNGDRIRRQLQEELQRLLASIDRLADIQGELTFDDMKTFIDDRFKQVPGDWKDETLPDSDPDAPKVDLSSVSAFFPNLPTQVVMRIDKTDVGSIAGVDPWRYYATLDQAIEFRTVVTRVLALFAIIQVPRWKDTSHRLAEIDSAWGNYLEKGFSQYPWESLLNSYATDFAWDRPPDDQWILLHPELGVIMDLSSSRGASAETGVLLHGLGYVRYFGDERDWFAGLSATAAVTENSDYGLGYGVTLHLGHSKIHNKIPHVSVSVLWQDFDTGGHGPVIALSLDLGRLFSDGGENSYRSRLGIRDPDAGMR